jgi:hypothetical protein
MEFTHNLEDLLNDFNTSKHSLVRYLQKHFIEDVNFKRMKCAPQNQNGGQNKITILLTSDTYNLCKTSYNLKNRYTPLLQNMEQVRTIMTLENQTIGFIMTAYKGIAEMIRQKRFENYYVDLYFPEHQLVVE